MQFSTSHISQKHKHDSISSSKIYIWWLVIFTTMNKYDSHCLRVTLHNMETQLIEKHGLKGAVNYGSAVCNINGS